MITIPCIKTIFVSILVQVWAVTRYQRTKVRKSCGNIPMLKNYFFGKEIFCFKFVSCVCLN